MPANCLLTQGLDLLGSLVDFVRDTSLVQKNTEEESGETRPHNHDMRVLAVADRRGLGGVF